MDGTQWIGLILVGIISLAVGVGLGVFFASQRDRPRVRSGHEETPDNLRELVRLYLDPATDKVYPAMEGRIYRSRLGLSGARLQRLQEAVARLLRWLEPETSHGNSGQPAAHQDEDILPATPETESRPGVAPIDALARALQPQVPKSESAGLSIVAQVDEILQEKIAGTGLENRGLSLSEAPDTGLVVWVGMDRYTEIDAVPDLEIRQVIRSAVAEWERRQESEP